MITSLDKSASTLTGEDFNLAIRDYIRKTGYTGPLLDDEIELKPERFPDGKLWLHVKSTGEKRQSIYVMDLPLWAWATIVVTDARWTSSKVGTKVRRTSKYTITTESGGEITLISNVGTHPPDNAFRVMPE